jgi:aminopeptidase-like protein
MADPKINTGEMIRLMRKLFPLCRSITGNGNRETLKIIGEHIPVHVYEVPSGTRVLNWEVPKEWNITSAYIKDSSGKKIIDFANSNLHILNYSIPLGQTMMSLEELKPHLFSIPDKPTLIPYRTSYYKENWGFCLSHDQLETLKDDTYEVCINSDLSPGSLTYGELEIKGHSEEVVLISTHICHPSLCNDNLSGMAVSVFLASELMRTEPFYTYKFLFIPGTIGAITWLALNEQFVNQIKYGLVTALLGIDSLFTYKRSRIGNAKIDQFVEFVLSKQEKPFNVIDFVPYGYDERQFCSPGFNLPVGNLSRLPFGEYPEYHTSADNFDLISEAGLESSFKILTEVIKVIEIDRRYINRFPKGEIQLGKFGLYDTTGGSNESKMLQLALLWILNYSDGKHSLADICILSGIHPDLVKKAVEMLLAKDLLIEA